MRLLWEFLCKFIDCIYTWLKKCFLFEEEVSKVLVIEEVAANHEEIVEYKPEVEEALPNRIQAEINSGTKQYDLCENQYNAYENKLKGNTTLVLEEFFQNLDQNLLKVCPWLTIPLNNLNNIANFKADFKKYKSIEELREKIKQSALKKEDADIDHLYKSFEKIQELNDLCIKYNIERKEALTDSFNYNEIKIISPSREFYTNKVQLFTNIDFLKRVDYTKNFSEVNETEESLIPCAIVDEKNDASPENLSATVIELIDSKNKRYILTSDAGVESFDDMEKNGFTTENLNFVQLPHHGSRRNISTNWIGKFAPEMFLISAEGNKKHPRKAVISCIKKNLPNCKIYSTHKNKETISYTTNRSVFPNRNWGNAEPI